MSEKLSESHERVYKGLRMSGFMMLFIILLLICAAGWGVTEETVVSIAIAVVSIILAVFALCGFVQLEPNQSIVLLFFGKYSGTMNNTGLWWVNPFLTKRKISLRVHNLDIAPIKVNDRMGNPVMIGMVLVWRVEDTYRATFDVAASGQLSVLSNFVAIQGDAALREVAGHYAYDNDGDDSSITLRGGGDAINELLESKINERLAIAGITVVEARINYIAYAPEIAAVMLRRQQAAAIIAAREKIVEGAVTMVQTALDQLSQRGVVTLEGDQRATIVGNLLMVLCSDEGPQTVIPTHN